MIFSKCSVCKNQNSELFKEQLAKRFLSNLGLTSTLKILEMHLK